MHPTFQPVDVVLIRLRFEGSNYIRRLFPWVCSSVLGQVPKTLPAVINVVQISPPLFCSTESICTRCGDPRNFESSMSRDPRRAAHGGHGTAMQAAGE
jgi:hypothetical protein